jgi:predicted esterase
MEYFVFVSKKVDHAKPSPLVIGLHGLGTPPDRWLSRITDAVDQAGFIAVAPMGYSLTGGYGATGPGRSVGATNVGALSEKDVLNVLELARQEFNVDERRIYLVGHSMGGAGALYLGTKLKEIWAAVAASAPAVRTDLRTPADLEQAAELPIFFAHGDADAAVPVQISRDWAAKAKSLGMTYEYLELRGAGHDSLGQCIDAIFKFFGKHVKRQPPT